MKYISLFSGIEAATVAWEPLGWEPLAFCEIDEFPSAVLAYRYPNVPNLGDITQVDWKDVIERHGRPDVVVGGSPCQSFSVAGGRASLDGESRLMFEYIRALAEIRPKWFLWENVPGVLNTRDDAFAQLLGEVQDIGYLSLAWRVLDAQFFGVAQRRRRVFLVGHLGSGGGAAAVLFESESVRGNTQTSRQKREELARAAGRGAKAGGGESLNGWDVQSKRVFDEDGIAPTISSGTGEGANIQQSVLQEVNLAYRTMPMECPVCGSDAEVSIDDPQEPEEFWRYSCGCSSLGCKMYGRMRRSWPTREDAITDWNKELLLCYSIDYKQTPKVNDEISHTLTHEGDGGIHSAVLQSAGFKYHQGAQAGNIGYEDEQSPTLTADYHQPAVALQTGHTAGNGSVCNSNGSDIVGALCAGDGTKGVGSQYVNQGKIICQRAKS